jgi:hypothetical protein
MEMNRNVNMTKKDAKRCRPGRNGGKSRQILKVHPFVPNVRILST